MRSGFTFRDLTDPIASRKVGSPTRTGAILLAFVLLAVTLVFLNKVPFLDSQSGYTATADFAAANNVTDLTPVRVDGVDVGQVTGLGAGPNPQTSSQVTMKITNRAVVLHSDASASIRWRTVLGGNMYIDLNPGSSDAPKLNGAIPVSQTSNQVELDDVLRIYNGSTDQAQRSMIAGLSQTFGTPAATDKSINALPDLTTVGRGLAPYQGTDPGDLSKLVVSTAHTVSVLSDNTAGLQTLVDGAANTLSAIDDQRTALGQTLELGPGTLQSTKITTARVDVTLRKLDPLVTQLQPGASLVASTSRAAKPALRELATVLNDAQPLLASARPTFANLRTTASTGVPLLQQLQAPLAALNSNILPWLSEKSSDTDLLNYEAIGPFFSVVNGAAKEYDSSGFRIHLSTLVGTGSVLDESDLLAGSKALMSQCAAVATSAQSKNCGAVSGALTSMLYGGNG